MDDMDRRKQDFNPIKNSTKLENELFWTFHLVSIPVILASHLIRGLMKHAPEYLSGVDHNGRKHQYFSGSLESETEQEQEERKRRYIVESMRKAGTHASQDNK